MKELFILYSCSYFKFNLTHSEWAIRGRLDHDSNISKVVVKVEGHDDFHIDNEIHENSENASTTSKYPCHYTGAKIFKCDQCDYKNSQLGNLKRHKLRHTGEKPFKCLHCDKAYLSLNGLNYHMKKHSYLKL